MGRRITIGSAVLWIAPALVSGVALLFMSRPADANQVGAYVDGNRLYDACTSGNSDGCMSYVSGVVDTLLFTGVIRNAPGQGASICLPPSVIQQQLVDVVTNYLTAHPETRQYAAASEVSAALKIAFPCPTP